MNLIGFSCLIVAFPLSLILWCVAIRILNSKGKKLNEIV